MRADVALLVLEVEDRPSATTDDAAAILSRVLADNISSHVRDALRDHLQHHTDRFEPRATALAVVSAMEREKNAYALAFLSSSLSSLSSRLEPSDAAKLCGRAANVVVSAMEPEKKTIALESLSYGLPSLSSSLSSLWSRLAPSDAAKLSERLVSAMEREKDANARDSLLRGLSSLSSRLEPSDAAKLCGRAASVVVSAIERKDEVRSFGWQPYDLSSLASRLEPSDAAKLSERLASAMEQEKHQNYPFILMAEPLSSLLSRLEPPDAAKLCGRAASVVVSAMEREKDATALTSLSSGLSSLSSRLEPSDAAKLCGRAASVVVSAMERQDYRYPRLGMRRMISSPYDLSSLASRLEPSDAAKLAQRLVSAMEREKDAHALYWLSVRLSSLGSRLEPSDAAKLCRRAIRQLVRGRAEDREDQGMPAVFVQSVATLLPFIDPPTAHALARELAPGMTDLETVLRDTSRPVQIERAGRIALATIGQRSSGHLAASFLIATEPYPCRLTTQELVDLLKMPTCFGDARRGVLDHLGNRYGRRFANHWEFVRFAHEKGLNLDLKTPPRRPDPKASLKRMLEVLGAPVAKP